MLQISRMSNNSNNYNNCALFLQEGQSKILNMKQLQPDSEFQKLLKDCTNTENCK